MRTLLKGGRILKKGDLVKRDVLIENAVIADVAPSIPENTGDLVFFFEDCIFLPGFLDVHVHLREPGFFYKETIKTGTLAGARGGYTGLFAMPNVDPVPDREENIKKQLEIIKKDAVIPVVPYASITKGQKGEALCDFGKLRKYTKVFSDDGRGVQDEAMMRRAMIEAKRVGGIICAHCEDESELSGGYVHDGEYAKIHGHKGISAKSEWGQIARDIALLRETGARYHVCHVSTKESVALIRQAKKEGLDITAETAPHYLMLCDEDLQEDGRFKMNPPIRGKEDRDALIAGIKDGTIDIVATDHAPHSAQEKSRGLKGSLNGVVGLECAFPVLYTGLVKTGTIDLERLVDLMSRGPRRIMGMEDADIDIGKKADIAVIDVNRTYKIDPETFLSMGKSTPFAGMTVDAENIMTIAEGKIVWKKEE